MQAQSRGAEEDASIWNTLRILEDAGLLYKIQQRLNPVYEAARLAAEHDGLHALLYSVKGVEWRFASNLVVNRRILYKILGAGSDSEAYEAILSAINNPGRLEERGFKEYFAAVGLTQLPALRFYERDGGRYITSSIFIACDDEGVCNASIHRIMVSDSGGYAAVRVVPRHLYAILAKAGSEGLPVAVVIGVDARVLVAAAASPPYGVFELEVAARLLGGRLRACRTPRYGIPVPCGASLVVEARLGPDRAPEGPFVDLLGLYDRAREEPVLHTEEVYVNKVYEPVVHAILPGGVEHMLLMGFPREAAIYDAVRRAVSSVVKVRLTKASGMWLHAVVSIKKQHDGDAKTAAMAALSAHPSLKHVIVVDEDIDPDDMSQVEWAIATRLQASRGLVVIPHARGSTLDPSAEEGLTYKLIVDATMPLSHREKYMRPRIPVQEGGGGRRSSVPNTHRREDA